MSDIDLRVEGRVLSPSGIVDNGAMLVRDGKLSYVGPASAAPNVPCPEVLSLSGRALVVPGFVDLHVHGAAGFDFIDATDEAIEAICVAHARHGTTGLCATILADAPERMLAAAAAVANARPDGARVLGIHLEGPFLNPRRAGAQAVEHLRAPDAALLKELLAAGEGAVRIVTLAPELPGALELVALLVDRGVTVSMGHSDATAAEARQAIDAGCTQVTHLFNAMRPLHHREPGLVGAVLDDDSVTAEVIADGAHVCSEVLRLIWRLKRPDKLALITDCTAALGAAPGRARLGDRPVNVEGGVARLSDGTIAGSVLTMDRAVANVVACVGLPLPGVMAAASRVPARVLGLNDRGLLEVGCRADFVIVDDGLAPVATYVEGRRVSGGIPG